MPSPGGRWPRSGRMRGGRHEAEAPSQKPSPGGEAFRHAGLAYEIRAGGACPRPYKAPPEVHSKLKKPQVGSSCRGVACLARQAAMPERQKSTLRLPGQRKAFPWGKVAPKGPDEGRDAVSTLRVGARHAPPAVLQYLSSKNRRRSLPGQRKAFPWRGSLNSKVPGRLLRVKALSCLQRVARRKP